MTHDYRELVLREILERGFYWMANVKLSTEYVEQLRSRGHDAYVIHGLGDGGVKDVIFIASYAPIIKKFLLNRRENVKSQLSVLNEAIEELEKLIHGK